MNQIFRFPTVVERDPAIDAWMKEHQDELGAIALRWSEVMRERGDDVREILHDGHPTACVADAAFAYVNSITAHVNVGFFRGAELADPLVPGEEVDIAFALHPTSVRFRKGHRIRLAIAGADRGSFSHVPAKGVPRLRVAWGPASSSIIDLPVVDG